MNQPSDEAEARYIGTVLHGALSLIGQDGSVEGTYTHKINELNIVLATGPVLSCLRIKRGDEVVFDVTWRQDKPVNVVNCITGPWADEIIASGTATVVKTPDTH